MKNFLSTAVVLCLTGLATAVGQPFTFNASQVNIVVAPSFDHAPVGAAVNAAQDFDFNALQVQSDSPWVTPSVDAARREVLLTFKTASLINSSYTATITAQHGADQRTFFVRAVIAPLKVVKLIDDPFRSRVYGVHQNGIVEGAVIVYDPLEAKPVANVSAGRKPTDLAVSNDGTELFAINSVEKSITVIDLTSLRVKETIQLTAYEQWSPDSHGYEYTSANLKVGKGDILYYTDAAWAPTLRVFNRVTRQVLQSVQIGSNGFGDFALTTDFTKLVAWAQYGWSAGWAGSYLADFTVSTSGTLTAGTTTDSNYPTTLSRDPLDTPVFISNDNKLAFAKRLAVRVGAIRETQRSFPTDVYSISPGGEIAATKDALFETDTGNKLLDLPVATTAQTITSDYARLIYFNPQTRAFGAINLLEAIDNDIINRDLNPPDGAIVLSPESLRWQAVPGAQSYRVYLGTSEAEVAAATPGSPLFLGETQSPMFALPQKLAPGTTYYWRIDTVSSGGVAKGAVFRFTVSEISASVSSINAATVRGHANYVTTIDLASEGGSKAWQASSTSPWIGFQQASGVTPATLRVVLNASQLAPGVHNGSISISGSAGGAFTIPVKLRVEALNVTMLKSDRDSALVYAISERTAADSAGAFLLEVDSATESVVRVLPVGTAVSDLAVHAIENAIYVANWKAGTLRVIDQASMQLVRTLNFAPAGPVGSSEGDVFRVTPGAAGRVIVEEYDQWIDVSLINSATGAELTQTFERQGGGASDPTGRFYYHGDDNSSGAELHKFDLTGDRFTRLTKVRLNPLSYYGSRIVVASEDGSRIFWNGMVHDANLAPVTNLAQMVYAATANGRYAFGEKEIYDTQTGGVAFGMPADTTASAFNSKTGKLGAQVGSAVRFFPLGDSMPAPVLTTDPASSTSVILTWTDNSLETGFTIQRRVAGTTTWEDIAGGAARNATMRTITGLSPGVQYEFRIKADSPASTSGWSNIATATTSTGNPSPTPQPSAPPAQAGKLANIATRMAVGTGDDALIAGFIITGSQPKKVIIRALGPQLAAGGLAGALTDPTLELNYPNEATLFNDNWKDSQQQEIEASTIPPNFDAEAAIIATLQPGFAYTAVVRGKEHSTGVGLVEVYDLDSAAPSNLANISTRGLVKTGDEVMIGGLIVGGAQPARVLIRALGPSLTARGVSGALADPVLELHDSNGNVVINDNWRESQEKEIVATSVPPSNDNEAAMLSTLAPGGYTAVVRGKADGTGVALIEAYNVQ
jgi:hypothetical protein